MSTAAVPESREPLGTLMCRAGLITAEQLAHALAVQASTGRPLGEVIVTLGYASRGAVANALAEQFGGTLKTEYGVSVGLGLGKPKPEEPKQQHLLVVSTPDGEALVRREGACPEPGTVVRDRQGRSYVVKRVEELPAAFLEPAP